jgi:hypothetical protein
MHREKQSGTAKNKPPLNLTSRGSVEYVALRQAGGDSSRTPRSREALREAKEGTNFGSESRSQRTPRGYELVSQLSRGFLIGVRLVFTNNLIGVRLVFTNNLIGVRLVFTNNLIGVRLVFTNKSHSCHSPLV